MTDLIPFSFGGKTAGYAPMVRMKAAGKSQADPQTG
jgi:hypothetical protein